MTGQDTPPLIDRRDLTIREIFDRMKLNEFFGLLGACVAALGSAYAFGASPPWSHSPAMLVADSTGQPENAKGKVFHGYYGDLKDDGTPTISDETLSMESFPDSQVKARAKGEVKTKDGRISRVWDFRGFQKGDRLSISFSTVRTTEDPIAPGIGAYLLEQEDSSDYTGTAIFFDCAKRAMIQCPYALTTQNIDLSNAKNRWPKLFEHGCTELNLIPDSPAKNVAITGSCQVANAR